MRVRLSPRPLLHACLAVLLAGAGLAPSLIAEEELHLDSGMIVVGDVISETPDTVVLRTQALIRHTPLAATLTYRRDQIDSRRTVPSFHDQYLARAPLSPDTVEGHLALARWCMDCCLVPEALENAQRAEALDSYNQVVAQLFKDLGYVKDQGHWVSVDDAGYKASHGAALATAASVPPASSAATATPPMVAARRPLAPSPALPARDVSAAHPAQPAGAASDADTATPVAVSAIPAGVLAVMSAAAAGHPLSDYISDTEDGHLVYSAEFTRADGIAMEVTVTKEGALVDVSPEADEAPTGAAGSSGSPARVTGAPATAAAGADVEITARAVPAIVLAAMTKAAGGAPVSDYVRSVDDGEVVFSAEFTNAAGTVMEITVGRDGTVLDLSPEAADEAPSSNSRR